MKKKEFLTEAKRKAIISEKEKAIIESFAKTFNKIKRTDERRINEDLTLQYADRPTASSPIVEIGYEDDGILHKFGFNFREDEEINLSDLFRGIATAKRGIQDAIEGASDLRSFDFQREFELLKKLTAFANQSKMDNNNVVMLKSNMNHPNQEWNDKEEEGMNDYHDYMGKQDDYDSYKYQGLSEFEDSNQGVYNENLDSKFMQGHLLNKNLEAVSKYNEFSGDLDLNPLGYYLSDEEKGEDYSYWQLYTKEGDHKGTVTVVDGKITSVDIK